eukprot:COSAG06_NODE_1278_length_10031_cov_105.662002_2_plen_101_part_00
MFTVVAVAEEVVEGAVAKFRGASMESGRPRNRRQMHGNCNNSSSSSGWQGSEDEEDEEKGGAAALEAEEEEGRVQAVPDWLATCVRTTPPDSRLRAATRI